MVYIVILRVALVSKQCIPRVSQASIHPVFPNMKCKEKIKIFVEFIVMDLATKEINPYFSKGEVVVNHVGFDRTVQHMLEPKVAILAMKYSQKQA